MTRLLALYHRPEGGQVDASFETAYRTEHLPFVSLAPGLRALRAWRVAEELGGETDIFLVAEMDFADREALRSALGSEPMRQAARVLRRIAPGRVSLLIVDEAADLLPRGKG